MTEFSDLGKHCSVADCHQQDFLPFKCDYCEDHFCLEHFTAEAHSCKEVENYNLDKRVLVCPVCQKSMPIEPHQDPNIVWERHNESSSCSQSAPKPRCPVERCRTQLTSINSYECKKCRTTVCMKHRDELDHPCKEFEEKFRQSQKKPFWGGQSAPKKPSGPSAAKAKPDIKSFDNNHLLKETAHRRMQQSGGASSSAMQKQIRR
eukprot:Platyproteum_vivax@DN5619_c0_g1_i1.p1